MKIVTSIFALVILVVAIAGAWSEEAGKTWITEVTIISPENLEYIGIGNVLIENGRIARVDRKTAPKKVIGATLVSGKGLFLIPGLIDSHVHIASVPGLPLEMILGPRAAKSTMIDKYFEQLPRSYLRYGYTTLVDLGVIDQKPLDNFRQAPLHPDLYDCGASLPLANGYPMSNMPPEDRFKLFPNFIYDPRQVSTIPSEYKPQDHTPAADIAAVKRSGGICIKTYFERGFGRDRNLPVMDAAILADIRRAATENGLPLIMHANSFEAQKFAVDGNVDVLAHGMWSWGDLDQERKLPPEITEVLDKIAQKKIGYQPTIQVLQGLRVYFDPYYLKNDAIPKVIPAEMLEWYNTPEGKWFRKELADDKASDSDMRDRYDNGIIRHARQVVTYLANKDANFLFGTDTPSGPTYGNLPGLNGYLEMERLHEAGLSLKQILRAATISNARELKIDSQVGTIEQGKIANLVLLKKSPLESVDAYDSIVTIWVHGKQISRDGLAVDPGK